jgi:cyanophycinase
MSTIFKKGFSVILVLCLVISSLLISSPVTLATSPGSSEVAKIEVNSAEVTQSLLDRINTASTRNQIRDILIAENLFTWSSLTGTGRNEAAQAVLDLRGTGYVNAEELAYAIKQGIFLGKVNDIIYYSDGVDFVVNELHQLNPPTWADLDETEQFAVAMAVYVSGTSSSRNLYGNISSLQNAFQGSLTSVSEAALKPVSYDVIDVGETSSPVGYHQPINSERIFWASSDRSVATVNSSGTVTARSFGASTITYVVINSTTYSVIAFGIGEVLVGDKTPPNSIVRHLIEGNEKNFRVFFDKPMHSDTRAITDIHEFLTAAYVKNGDEVIAEIPINSSANSVNWLLDSIVEIILPTTKIDVGQTLELHYSDKVTDLTKNKAVPASSDKAVADTFQPVGAIATLPVGKISSLKVTFNKPMSEKAKKISNLVEFAHSITIHGGASQASIPVRPNKNAVQWTTENGRDVAFIAIPETKIVKGNYATIDYKNKVTDTAGNRMKTDGTAIAVGGSLQDNNVEFFEQLRKHAGGKFPTIAFIGSASPSSAVARNSYYVDTASYMSYERLYYTYGLTPVFIPIGVDNYHTEAFNPDNVALLNSATAVFLNGGDQSRHARSFINDDGSDTPLLTALRGVYATGGVISGSSAGAHIQSNPMFGGGTSYSELRSNTPGGNGIEQGFDFVTEGILDSHFDARGRLGRLVVRMRDTNNDFGFGPDENTAMLFHQGVVTVFGQRGGFVIDGSKATYGKDDLFGVEGLNVHYLTSGDSYHFKTRKVTSNKDIITKPIFETYYDSSNIFAAYETTRVMTNLVGSPYAFAYGDTVEADPRFTLKFSKNSRTKGYYNGTQFTIDSMGLDIIANLGEKESRD